jgi:peptidoglycan/LPS O-acetylase OafA/YrhL
MGQIELTHTDSVGAKEPTPIAEMTPSAIPGAVARPAFGAEVAPANKPKRLSALDFTKGFLVLTMVFYHWMNYFVRADGSVYKYIRFLTPSFIFITGFLIAHVYLSSKKPFSFRTPGRMIWRGLKLLAIVALLNIVLSTVHLSGMGTRLSDWPAEDIALAFFTGVAPVAFSVLVPIAYLLIVAAVLMIVFRSHKYAYHLACALCVAGTLVLDFEGSRNNYLQIFSLGMLGLSLGFISIERVNSFVKRWPLVFAAYLGYLYAITIWDVTYPLQIVGVCLSVAIIYLIGLVCAESSYAGRTVVLLGQYSLFAYIAQIVILQLLRKVLRPYGLSISVLVAALLTGALLTTLTVIVLDRVRGRVGAINKMYTVVFG